MATIAGLIRDSSRYLRNYGRNYHVELSNSVLTVFRIVNIHLKLGEIGIHYIPSLDSWYLYTESVQVSLQLVEGEGIDVGAFHQVDNIDDRHTLPYDIFSEITFEYPIKLTVNGGLHKFVTRHDELGKPVCHPILFM